MRQQLTSLLPSCKLLPPLLQADALCRHEEQCTIIGSLGDLANNTDSWATISYDLPHSIVQRTNYSRIFPHMAENIHMAHSVHTQNASFVTI